MENINDVIHYEFIYNLNLENYYEWCDYVKSRNDIYHNHKNYLEMTTDYREKYFKVCFNIDNPLFNYILKRFHKENPSYEDYYDEEDRFEAGYEKQRYEKLIKENEYWKIKYDKLILQLVYESTFSIPSLTRVFSNLT